MRGLVDISRRDMGSFTRGNYYQELEHFDDRRGMGWVTMEEIQSEYIAQLIPHAKLQEHVLKNKNKVI